jgi:hypothetical protein
MFAESKVGAAQTSNGALNLPPFLVCLCGVDASFSFFPQFPTGSKQCAGGSLITTSSGYLKNIGLKRTAGSGYLKNIGLKRTAGSGYLNPLDSKEPPVPGI